MQDGFEMVDDLENICHRLVQLTFAMLKCHVHKTKQKLFELPSTQTASTHVMQLIMIFD